VTGDFIEKLPLEDEKASPASLLEMIITPESDDEIPIFKHTKLFSDDSDEEMADT
jgi:hypothetical protein